MESLEHAMKRDVPIIAEYLGGAVNCDAYHMTDPRADGFGVSSCIRKSLEDAGVAPEEVIQRFFYVLAHKHYLKFETLSNEYKSILRSNFLSIGQCM